MEEEEGWVVLSNEIGGGWQRLDTLRVSMLRIDSVDLTVNFAGEIFVGRQLTEFIN